MADVKMTDEKVAVALGWRKVHAKRQWGGKPCRVWERGDVETPKLPAFTTSLDAITAEIEARGLYWAVKTRLAKRGYWAGVDKHQIDAATHSDSTAPLALCAALLAYLKENKR